jgi:hypothetical protein
MASFHTKTFTKHDDYMTPKSAWEAIKHFIPKDKTIWEAFYGNGDSGNFLRELGFTTIHEDVDFYQNDLGEMIVSNPPFSDCKNVMKRLAELDKPFILIMPSSKINTSYFRENFMNKGIQIIIPRKRIQFVKLVDGQVPDNYKSVCNFDCFYYCYKIGLKESITWLD